MSIQWEDWIPKQVVTSHAQFTGFGPDGNGDDLLIELADLGADVHGPPDEMIEFRNRDGEDVTWAHPGDWVICGTQGEFYPVAPEVHADKYDRRPS